MSVAVSGDLRYKAGKWHSQMVDSPLRRQREQPEAQMESIKNTERGRVKGWDHNWREVKVVTAEIRILSTFGVIKSRQACSRCFRTRKYSIKYIIGHVPDSFAPLPSRHFWLVSSLLVDVADGAIQLHRLGVVHRDIKPENVLVFHSEELGVHAKLADFGLARGEDLLLLPTNSRCGNRAFSLS